jgi:hypothetical protein
MQTIVVLIAQEPNGDRPGEKQSPHERIENAARRNGAPQPATREKSTPPFWTWFIENPRRHRAL